MSSVSVVLPVYNVEKYLEKCLDSVIGQTLKDIEIICVDDGSTDRSGEILEAYEKKDSRIRVLHQENQYAGAARNRGLMEAAGKYVIFWDSDDYFEKTALEKLYRRCEADQAQIGVCAGKRLDDATGLVYPVGAYLNRRMLPKKLPFSKKDIPRYLFNFTTNVPWNKLYLREFILEHGLRYQTLRQANDVYFSMMALFFADRITVVKTPLVTYRVDNPQSLTGKASVNQPCTIQAYRSVLESLSKEKEFSEAVRQSFTNKAWDALLYSLKTQRNVQAYMELFSLYKEQALEEFGIAGQKEDYIYNEQQREDLRQMQRLDGQEFLLYQFRSCERRFQIATGKRLILESRFGNRVERKLSSLLHGGRP